MRKMILLVALSLNTLLNAQLNTPFANFEMADFDTGIFMPYGRVLNNELHSGEAFTPFFRRDVERMLFSLRKAQLGEPSLPELQELTHLQHLHYEWSGAQPISLYHIAFDDFAQEAAENGWIALADGEFIIEHDPEETLITARTFFAHLLDDYYTAGTQRFIFPLEARYGWSDLASPSVEVDFDDGLGFRNIEWDTPIEVTYSDQSNDRLLRLRLTTEDAILKTAIVLRSSGATSEIPLPETPPWGVPDPADPWMIQTTHLGAVVSGNAYTLLSEDGIFDRPFLFVEGIDFGQTHGMLRNGSFGWYEFSSGNAANYSFLYNMPVLLQWLRSEGYDIVMLDFSNGSDYVERNAALLKHLIELVKSHKLGHEELVVAGASMGGQVSRVALREMELEGSDHCTRLWISMDSPHLGAAIPLSLQHTLYELEERSASAADFVANYLEVPAARQMLLAHAGDYSAVRSDYQSYLNELGYPEDCRSVAIANGSRNGTPLDLAAGAPLLDYECEALGVILAKFYLLSHPGDPYHDLSTPLSNLLSQTIFVEDVNCTGIGCILSAIFSQVNTQSFAGTDQPHYDTCPGGKRPSIAQFADALNAELSGAGNLGMVCDTQVSNYYPDHSFIPTVSALGLTSELSASVELIIEDEGLLPFDSFYAPENNTLHSELTNEMLNFIWGEVTLGEPILADELNQNLPSATFNFGLPAHFILDPVVIYNEGELQINGAAPIHFGNDPDLFPEPGSTMYVRTSECHPGEIVIDNNGQVLLGAENSQCSGILDIRKGSTLRVKEGGLLRLVEKSQIIIREGAKLVAEGGVIDVSDGSTLTIEPGAELEILDSEPLLISDPDSRILVGGSITMAPNVDAVFTHLPNHSNGALVFNGAEAIQGDFTNRLYILGSNSSDLLLEVAEHSELATAPGFEEVRIEDGNVRFHHSAMLSTTASFSLRNASVVGLGEPDGFVLYNAALVENCIIQNCAFTALLNYESVRFLNDALTEAPIRVYGGSYRVESCNLTASPIESWLRDFNARILSSSFTGCADAAVRDESIPLLRVVESDFYDNDKGVVNSGGELLLRCNSFTGCGTGVVAGSFTYLNMSSDAAAGYNYFDDNDTHIRLHATLGMLLLNGYNSFLSFDGFTFYGNMAGTCDDMCSLILNASKNTWQYGSPLDETYQIHIPNILCDSNSPLNPFEGCHLQIIDKSPVSLTACGAEDIPPQNADLSGKSLSDETKSKEGDGYDCYTRALLEQAKHFQKVAHCIDQSEHQLNPGITQDLSLFSAGSVDPTHIVEGKCYSNSAYFAHDLLMAAALHAAGETDRAQKIASYLQQCLKPGIQQKFASIYAKSLAHRTSQERPAQYSNEMGKMPKWTDYVPYTQSLNTKDICGLHISLGKNIELKECEPQTANKAIEQIVFDISPNPTYGVFRITSSTTPDQQTRWHVQVRSLDGQSVMNVRGTGNWPSIDLNNYAAGVYLVSVHLEDVLLGTKRLVVMR